MLSKLRPWTDDHEWIGDVVRAAPGDEKLSVLFWWVIAAGGWIEGTTAKLPPLPAGLARNELHRMPRQHGLDIETTAAEHDRILAQSQEDLDNANPL